MEIHSSFNSNSTSFFFFCSVCISLSKVGLDLYISLSKVALSKVDRSHLSSFMHMKEIGGQGSCIWNMSASSLGQINTCLTLSIGLTSAYSHHSWQQSRKKAETFYWPKQVAKPSQIQRVVKQTPHSVKAAKSHCIEKGMQTLKCE